MFNNLKVVVFFALSALSLQVHGIRAFFDYKSFYHPGQGAYVEFILSFDGASARYATLADGRMQASAEVLLLVTLAEKVIDYRKSVVMGPELQPGAFSDFMALERFMLPPGLYDLEVRITDLNDPAARNEVMHQKIDVLMVGGELAISDIELVSAYSQTTEVNAFSKSGYDLVPFVSNYYPSALNALVLYVEIYNSDKLFGIDEPFVVQCAVTDEWGKVVKEISRMKRQKAQPVVPQLVTLDISDLASGHYFVQVEVRDKRNEKVDSRRLKIVRNLQRVNQPLSYDTVAAINSFAGRYTHRDSLFGYVQALLPIASPGERITIDNMMSIATLPQMQGFFYQFWLNRDAQQPEEAWLKYKKQLADVDRAFGTRIKPGWRTDRGRVYLQYGPPNTRIERPHNPNYYPFEIWHYYHTNNDLHNRKFLFVNPSLSGDFELIHSNVYNEVQNADWMNLVRSDFRSSPAAVNRTRFNQRDTYSGDQLEELWNNPH